MRNFTFSLSVALGVAISGSAHADLVQDCTYAKDFRVAERACTDAINSGRWEGAELAWAFTNRGIAKYRQGRARDALADYEEAIRISPGYFDAHFGLGQAYCDLGDPGRSVDWYSEAIAGGAWEISDAQAFLAEEGHYYGTRSGVFDGRTRSALRQWALSACR